MGTPKLLSLVMTRIYLRVYPGLLLKQKKNSPRSLDQFPWQSNLKSSIKEIFLHIKAIPPKAKNCQLLNALLLLVIFIIIYYNDDDYDDNNDNDE